MMAKVESFLLVDNLPDTVGFVLNTRRTELEASDAFCLDDSMPNVDSADSVSVAGDGAAGPEATNAFS